MKKIIKNIWKYFCSLFSSKEKTRITVTTDFGTEKIVIDAKGESVEQLISKGASITFIDFGAKETVENAKNKNEADNFVLENKEV
ncbi:hypothetical protein [Lactococcus allomyrinae]|uniref:Uncharacterized protein n=1 Tax=Lactococcus allomyrinae TaxID=2419773 RepID=A0A387BFF8_9LACT|nr:hypothetical protein [Lactococcus allomyrinae]AYF99845.1 hypothetical protein D7I46_01350 [Lactococcus allomyrinae]